MEPSVRRTLQDRTRYQKAQTTSHGSLLLVWRRGSIGPRLRTSWRDPSELEGLADGFLTLGPEQLLEGCVLGDPVFLMLLGPATDSHWAPDLLRLSPKALRRRCNIAGQCLGDRHAVQQPM